MRFVRRCPCASFVLVTYCISWGAWVPMIASGGTVRVGRPHLLFLAGLLGPMLSAFTITALTTGRMGVRSLAARMVRWRIGWRWWGVALAAPLAVLAATIAALAVAGQSLPRWSDLGRFNGYPDLGIAGLWLALTLIGGFGEETGWRGFLLPGLQRRFSSLASSSIVALVWATWHWPLFFVVETYKGMSAAALPGFVLSLAMGAVFLTWLHDRSGRSVLAVAVWHGTFNLCTGSLAARGLVAAIGSVAVMIAGAALAASELRTMCRKGSRPAHDVRGSATASHPESGGPRVA